MNIRVVKRPRGEAPENVRAAWIGLSLPIAPGYSGPVDCRCVGVCSAPRSRLGLLLLALLGRGTAERGYFVDLTTAVDLLEKLNPQAAAWWRTNTPHLLRQGQNLLF